MVTIHVMKLVLVNNVIFPAGHVMVPGEINAQAVQLSLNFMQECVKE